MAYIKTGKPRGRPRKNPLTVDASKPISTIEKKTKEPKATKHVVLHDSSDLFKLVTEMAGHNLSETESQALLNAAKIFIRENFEPTQVFDSEFLKESVINNRLVTKKDFQDDDDDDDDDLFVDDDDADDMNTWVGGFEVDDD